LALGRFTAVFGMGTGAATPPEPPGRQSATKTFEKLEGFRLILFMNTLFHHLMTCTHTGRQSVANRLAVPSGALRASGQIKMHIDQ
jgi:hypothetical protein